MKVRRVSRTIYELVGHRRNGQDDEVVVVTLAEGKQSFPRLSSLILQMGRYVTSGCSIVRGALVVGVAKPRLLYAAEACRVEVWEAKLPISGPSSSWRRCHCQRRTTSGRLLTPSEIEALRLQVIAT